MFAIRIFGRSGPSGAISGRCAVAALGKVAVATRSWEAQARGKARGKGGAGAARCAGFIAEGTWGLIHMYGF